jgi:hypothetical protein
LLFDPKVTATIAKANFFHGIGGLEVHRTLQDGPRELSLMPLHVNCDTTSRR